MLIHSMEVKGKRMEKHIAAVCFNDLYVKRKKILLIFPYVVIFYYPFYFCVCLIGSLKTYGYFCLNAQS